MNRSTLKFGLVLSLSLLLIGSGIISTPSVVAGDKDDPVPAYVPDNKLDPSPVKLPKITKKQYNNGMKIYYVPQDELPVVSIRLLIPTGMLYNPMDNPGIVNFMADLLTEGTTNRTSTEIAEAMDFVGGNFGSGTGWNAIFIEATVLKRDFELALDIVSDIAKNANFPEQEIERLRPQWISGLMRTKDDPGTIAGQQFAQFVYGDHPYAIPSDGTMESVQGFTRDMVVEQFNRLVVPDQAILAISGNIPKKAKSLVSKYLGDWKARNKALEDISDPAVATGGEVLIIDKPDAVQSEIRMGYVMAPTNMGEDEHAFNVMNYIFGTGGFSSWMMLRIRNDLGLAYDARGYLSGKQKKGAYTLSIGTKNESTGLAVEETFGLIKKAIEVGFTEEELADAKAYLVGRYPAAFETPQGIATQFQSKLMFGYDDPEEYIRTYREKIAAVTLEEINAMAKKYFNPDNVRVVVVSKADDVKDQLSKFGNVTVKTLDEI